MYAWDVSKVLQAEMVAIGVEVGSGRKSRSTEWGQIANPTLPASAVLDDMTEERLLEMEQQAIEQLKGGRRSW